MLDYPRNEFNSARLVTSPSSLLLLVTRVQAVSDFTRMIATLDKFLTCSKLVWTLKHRKRYAILINTWKRYDLLKQSISHYTTCLGVESIHIVWSEPEAPPESLVTFLQQKAKENSRRGGEDELRFEINEEDSLNNRFKEIKGLKTEAIFSVDDDVIFPCSTVEFAFSVWQSAPETMVGFVPRMHWPDRSVCCYYFHFCACSSCSFRCEFLFSSRLLHFYKFFFYFSWHVYKYENSMFHWKLSFL